MALNPGTMRMVAVSTTPSAPPTGYCLIYFKADDILYIQDSSGVEVPIGTSTGITALTGDVTATGPGSAAATVVQVGGKTASAIAQAVDDVLAATASNTASTIVKRDASGNFIANVITAALTGVASGNLALTGGTVTGPVHINDATGASFRVDTDVLVVDGAGNKVGINKANPAEALDVVGNAVISGTIAASNLSGTNTGDVTHTDTDTVDIVMTGQAISANVRLSDSTITSDANGIKVGTIGDANIDPGVDATKLGSGSVSNTEFDYLSNVTSDIQDQLNDKSDTSHGHANATPSADGFMSAADKTKLDAATSSNTNSTIVQRDGSGGFVAGIVSQSTVRVRGSTNNVNITANPGADYDIVLPATQGGAGSVPQNDGAGNLTWVNPQTNIDGGRADSVYVASQIINGGTP